MYAVYVNDSWAKASPARAAQVATEANGGRVIGAAHLRTLPAAKLAELGVWRLDARKQTTAGDFAKLVPGLLVLEGGVVVQKYIEQDMDLETAKAEARAILAQVADEERAGPVPVYLAGKAWSFPMDADAVLNYTMLGTALASSVPYPTGGVPFWATDVEKGEKARVRVSYEEWQAVVGAMALSVVGVTNRESELEVAVEAAESVAALRSLNIREGW